MTDPRTERAEALTGLCSIDGCGKTAYSLYGSDEGSFALCPGHETSVDGIIHDVATREKERAQAESAQLRAELEKVRAERDRWMEEAGTPGDVLLEALKYEPAREWQTCPYCNSRFYDLPKHLRRKHLPDVPAHEEGTMGEQADQQIQDGFDALALGEDDNDCAECYCGVELVAEGKWAGFHFDGVGYRECSARAEAPAQEEDR